MPTSSLQVESMVERQPSDTAILDDRQDVEQLSRSVIEQH